MRIFQYCHTIESQYCQPWPCNLSYKERASASLVRFLIQNLWVKRELLLIILILSCAEKYFVKLVYPFTLPRKCPQLSCRNHIGRRTDYCSACNKTGGRDCPTLDVSFHLFCRKQCDVGEYLCKRKDWVSPRTHLCYDFFCDICEKSYKDSSRYKRYFPPRN